MSTASLIIVITSAFIGGLLAPYIVRALSKKGKQ
jgi:hypothetical protein